MSKILITGATGFIGARLAEIAHTEGHEVLGLGQANTTWEAARLSALRRVGVPVTHGSILDTDVLASACRNIDCIIHLAAAQHESGVPDEYFRNTNVNGTRLLLEAAERNNVKRFIYGSTIGVYGSSHGVALDESSELRPENIYGVTKLEAEQLVLQHTGNMQTSAVRISETYGPGDGRLLKLFKAVNSRRLLLIGDGANLHQLIFVDDLARGLLTVANHSKAVGEVFILAGREAISTRAMIDTIAAALDRKPSRLRVPLMPFSVAASVMELFGRMLGFTPPLTQRRLDFFRKSFLFGTDKACNVLDFTASVGFEEGARITANWYRENNHL